MLASGTPAFAQPAPSAPVAAPASSPASEDDLDVPVTKLAPADAGAPASPSTVPATPQDELAELRARVAALEKAASESAKAPVAPAAPVAPTVSPPAAPAGSAEVAPTERPTTSFDVSPWSRPYPHGFLVSGYVQAQYQQSQLSQDEVDANGNPLNEDRFLVRRARLRVERGWDFAYATIEIDGNNVNGLAIGLRRAEASLLWRGGPLIKPKATTESTASSATHLPPLPPIVLTVGLTDIPFGYELYEPNRLRLFLERTTASRAFFPGDADFGGRLSGALGFFRYALGAYDGTPLPDSSPKIAGFDSTSEKDLMARFGVETTPRSDLGVSGGVSFLRGTGFHQGTAATKGTLQWQDTNGNGVVDTGEVTGLPGQAATPSKTFGRWAIGADLQVHVQTPLGRGLAYGEVYVASNFDRGDFVADPVTTGVDVREVGWYLAYVQEITRYGLVGLRVDAYNPNADATTTRAGTLLPLDQTITTWSPLVGLVLPERARLIFEYDRVLNNEGIDSRGVPTTLKSDTWAIRLQVQI